MWLKKIDDATYQTYAMAAGGFVSRAEYNRLEERVVRAEQLIRAQNEQIKKLTQQAGEWSMQYMGAMGMGGMGAMGMGAMGMGAMGGRAGVRERTPRGNINKPPLPVPVNPAALQSLEEFIVENGLDEKCGENLRSQPLEVQQFVIGRGPAEGTNPSAMITARIAKCVQEYSIGDTGGDLGSKLEEFIAQNTLDAQVAQNLRESSTACQYAVLSLGPATGKNPSAMVQGRIAKFVRGRL